MEEFFARLKEHKLVQWTLGYIAVSFALIPVLDIVASRFGWPQTTVRCIIIALATGFFMMLVIAWYHGERGAQRITRSEHTLLAVLLVLGGLAMWRIGPTAAESSAATGNATVTNVATIAPIDQKSIAVLPLVNESDDKDQQYFSDGLSEGLITALSQFAGLKVIARNSSFQFRNSKDDAKTIGAKLGVAHLLEGSVQRAGDVVRISAELVNADDSRTLWSQRYDRPYKDLFALQDDITHAVATTLKAKLLDGGGAVVQSDRPPSGNLDAYKAYLQGQFYSLRHTAEDNRKAIGYHEEATRLDPKYALAYASLALSEVELFTVFSVSSHQERATLISNARAAAATALALDPTLGKAHQASGFILQVVDFDLGAANAEYQRAAELAPQDSTIGLNLGVVNASFGRLDEAVAYGRRSTTLDPLNSRNRIYLARSLDALGRYDEAEATVRKAIELHPQAAQSYSELAVIQIRRGNIAAAVSLAQQETDPFWRTYALALAHFANGDRVEADAALKQLLDQYADSGAFQIAQVYALRKEPDKMFEWLDHGLATHDPGVTTLLYAPFLGAYRTDPRFAAFCKKIGVPVPGSMPAAAVASATATPDHP